MQVFYQIKGTFLSIYIQSIIFAKIIRYLLKLIYVFNKKF